MNPREVKKVLDSEAGQAMKDFLLEELVELRKLDNLKEYKTPTIQAIETKSQMKAFDKLKEILNKLMTISDIDIEKAEKDSYYSI